MRDKSLGQGHFRIKTKLSSKQHIFATFFSQVHIKTLWHSIKYIKDTNWLSN